MKIVVLLKWKLCGNYMEYMRKNESEGQYGLVDKMHPSCVRPGFNTRVRR
jgi:hypothetical protein